MSTFASSPRHVSAWCSMRRTRTSFSVLMQTASQSLAPWATETQPLLCWPRTSSIHRPTAVYLPAGSYKVTDASLVEQSWHEPVRLRAYGHTGLGANMLALYGLACCLGLGGLCCLSVQLGYTAPDVVCTHVHAIRLSPEFLVSCVAFCVQAPLRMSCLRDTSMVSTPLFVLGFSCGQQPGQRCFVKALLALVCP